MYPYPHNVSFDPDTGKNSLGIPPAQLNCTFDGMPFGACLNWDLCKDHCLFDVGPGGDIAEEHDLSASTKPEHQQALAQLLTRFWELSNASGTLVADASFNTAQCQAAEQLGVWRPSDY